MATINLKCAAGATGRNTFIYRYIKTETEREREKGNEVSYDVCRFYLPT